MVKRFCFTVEKMIEINMIIRHCCLLLTSSPISDGLASSLQYKGNLSHWQWELFGFTWRSHSGSFQIQIPHWELTSGFLSTYKTTSHTNLYEAVSLNHSPHLAHHTWKNLLQNVNLSTCHLHSCLLLAWTSESMIKSPSEKVKLCFISFSDATFSPILKCSEKRKKPAVAESITPDNHRSYS